MMKFAISSVSRFDPPPAGSQPPFPFTSGCGFSLDLYAPHGTAPRLLMQEPYGHGVYDLADPVHPKALGFYNMTDLVPQIGDGSQTVQSVAAAADGSRILVAWLNGQKRTFLMRPAGYPSGAFFDFAGAYNANAVPMVLDQVGTRHFGYTLSPAGLTVAEVTSFVTGAARLVGGSVACEKVTAAPVSQAVAGLCVAGHFVVYTTGDQVVVIDARAPGPAGSIAAGFKAKAYPARDLGVPDGAKVVNVAATMHPTSGRLYVMAEGMDPVTRASVGLALAWWSPFACGDITGDGTIGLPDLFYLINYLYAAGPAPIGPADVNGDGVVDMRDHLYFINYLEAGGPAPCGSQFTRAGFLQPDAPRNVSTAACAVATADDLLAMSWSLGAGDVWKLTTIAASAPGVDLSPGVLVPAAQMQSPKATRVLWLGGRCVVYVADVEGGVAVGLGVS